MQNSVTGRGKGTHALFYPHLHCIALPTSPPGLLHSRSHSHHSDRRGVGRLQASGAAAGPPELARGEAGPAHDRQRGLRGGRRGLHGGYLGGRVGGVPQEAHRAPQPRDPEGGGCGWAAQRVNLVA